MTDAECFTDRVSVQRVRNKQGWNKQGSTKSARTESGWTKSGWTTPPWIKRLSAIVCLVCTCSFGLNAQATELIVSAASSLTNAFTTLSQSFEARHPGVKVILNFGASDTLLMQIVNGAPADVFASADQAAMDRAVAQQVVSATKRRDFAQNQVVLIVPSDSSLQVNDLADLAQSAITRVTYGNPSSVPIGRYARAALESAGQWSAVSAKGVVAQNVRQSLDYVVRGEVDAGFVFATDAAMVGNKVRVAYRVSSTTPVTYPIAPIVTTKQSQLAHEFVDDVLSEAGQAILAKYGFLKP